MLVRHSASQVNFSTEQMALRMVDDHESLWQYANEWLNTYGDAQAITMDAVEERLAEICENHGRGTQQPRFAQGACNTCFCRWDRRPRV